MTDYFVRLFNSNLVEDNKGSRFPRTGREDFDKDENVPGPGRYANHSRSAKKVKGGVIGTEKRTFIGPGNPNKTGDALGPGYYEEDYAYKMSQNKKSGKGKIQIFNF